MFFIQNLHVYFIPAVRILHRNICLPRSAGLTLESEIEHENGTNSL